MPSSREALSGRSTQRRTRRSTDIQRRSSRRARPSLVYSARDAPVCRYRFHLLGKPTKSEDGVDTARFGLKISHSLVTPDASSATVSGAFDKISACLKESQIYWERMTRAAAGQEPSPNHVAAWRERTRQKMKSAVKTFSSRESRVDPNRVTEPRSRVDFQVYTDPEEFDRLSTNFAKQVVVHDMSRFHRKKSPWATVRVTGRGSTGFETKLHASTSDLEGCKSALKRALAQSPHADHDDDCMCDWTEPLDHLIWERLVKDPQTTDGRGDRRAAKSRSEEMKERMETAVEDTVAELNATYPELADLSADVYWDGLDTTNDDVWVRLIGE